MAASTPRTEGVAHTADLTAVGVDNFANVPAPDMGNVDWPIRDRLNDLSVRTSAAGATA